MCSPVALSISYSHFLLGYLLSSSFRILFYCTNLRLSDIFPLQPWTLYRDPASLVVGPKGEITASRAGSRYGAFIFFYENPKASTENN